MNWELAHVEAHMFENVIFETETGGQMSKSFGLDMCLIMRSLVFMLVFVLLSINILFQLWPN